MPTRTGPPTVAGRWSRLPEREANATRRTTARTEALLERHGVLTRGAVMAEQVAGGFSAVYPVLRAFEENNRARRGYFVETLGAAQFGTPGSIDRLRTLRLTRPRPGRRRGPGGDRPGERLRRRAAVAGAPAAADDADAVDVGEGTGRAGRRRGHRAGRKAGALVVLVDGDLVLYVERGGKTLLSWTEDEHVLKEAATALSSAVSAGALGRMVVQKADGASVHESTRCRPRSRPPASPRRRVACACAAEPAPGCCSRSGGSADPSEERSGAASVAGRGAASGEQPGQRRHQDVRPGAARRRRGQRAGAASSGQPARCGITNCCSSEVIAKTAAIVSTVIRQRGPGSADRVKKLSSPATRA